MTAEPASTVAFLRPALAGGAATLSGNGLARFAYVPIFPAMVTTGWVDGGQAGALGAAALLGYLIGTLGGRPMARWFGVPRLLDLGMVLIVVSMAACAWNGGFWWFSLWRGAAGVAGGLLMAVAGPATQASVAPDKRGAAGGIVIAGVGVGIAAGAVVVPLILPLGLPMTWLALATITAVLWAYAHRHWPDMTFPATTGKPPRRGRLLVLTHGLHAAGMVAPMVYLADLAARGRGLGIEVGAVIWLVFGLAGIAGGILSGRVTDWIGGRPTLCAWLAIQLVALALALLPGPFWIFPAAATAGFAAIGATTVTLAVSRELAGAEATALWVKATAAFAVAQTSVGFALAAIFAWSGESHAAVFAVGLIFSAAALASAFQLARRGIADGAAGGPF